MINSHSEVEASQIIESLLDLPDLRKKCLTIFADSINEANCYGRNKWIVTCDKPNEVCLHVGHVIICALVEDGIWLALDRKLSETQRKSDLFKNFWYWDSFGQYKEYPEYPSIESQNGYFKPIGISEEDFMSMWIEIRRLHREAIYQAAQKWTKGVYTVTQKRHTSGVLKYLRNIFGVPVPDPESE